MRMRGTKLASALAILALVACGKVQFIPSPFTAQDVTLSYSPDEDLSVLRWRIAAQGDDASGVTFDLLQTDGSWKAIQFGSAPYASGLYPCSGGTCAQLVLRGRYAMAGGLPSPVRAHAPDGYVVPGLAVQQSVLVQPSLVVSAGFASDNLTINASVSDKV